MRGIVIFFVIDLCSSSCFFFCLLCVFFLYLFSFLCVFLLFECVVGIFFFSLSGCFLVWYVLFFYSVYVVSCRVFVVLVLFGILCMCLSFFVFFVFFHFLLCVSCVFFMFVEFLWL